MHKRPATPKPPKTPAPARQEASVTCQKCLRALLLLWLALVSGFATAQVNSDFNVTVNPGPSAPTTVFPGEPTALRITLINNSTANPITGVNYNGGFSTLGSAGLVIDDGFSGLTGDCSAGTLTVTPGQPTIVVSGVEIPARQDGVAGSGECYVDLSVRAFTTDGGSTTLNLEVAAGDVDSDQGTNATGGPQAITVQAVSRPTMSKAFSANNLLVLNGATRTLAITINNPDNNIDLTDVGLTDVFSHQWRRWCSHRAYRNCRDGNVYLRRRHCRPHFGCSSAGRCERCHGTCGGELYGVGRGAGPAD